MAETRHVCVQVQHVYILHETVHIHVSYAHVSYSCSIYRHCENENICGQ